MATQGDAGTKAKPKSTSRKGKQGAFTVIPNEFQQGMIRRERTDETPPDGTVIIDTEKLQWEFQGYPVTAYLVNQADKTVPRKPIDMVLEPLVPRTVYSFKLPDNLKPATYMMHIRDGDTQQSHALGNRRIYVYNSLIYICSNLFSEANLAALCDIPDLSSRENCDLADKRLSGYFDQSQIPLKLPQYLGMMLPTLLHVACYYGLETLFVKIMDTFCSLDSLNIMNHDQKKPGDLAKERGYDRLAELLSNQLLIQEMYVSHAPVEARVFYDVYNTVDFYADGDNGYVMDAAEEPEDPDDDEDGDDVYSEAKQPGPQVFRACSAREQRVTPQPPTPEARSQTLGRYNTDSLFSRDLPPDAVVSPDHMESFAKECKQTFHEVANGDINQALAEKHIRDWTRRMKSLRRLDIETRLETQRELRDDMSEQYAALNKEHDKKRSDIIVRPAEYSTAADTPPPLAPRKISNTVSQNLTKTRVKRLPAPPPKDPLANVIEPSGPIVPPRVSKSTSQNDDDYLVADATLPPREVRPRTNARRN